MANPASTVFITVPKYVAITPLPKIRPAMGPASPASSSCGEYAASVSSNDAEAPVQQRGKKRRLDHLTWEEKIQRKKLKNRVAAQTSRDRKKARMEEMEMEISELTQTTQMLQNKCESLQSINDSLLEKNQKLDMELEALRQQLADVQEQQKHQQHKATADAQRPAAPVATCAGCESILNGSAVSKYTDPLQQGSPQMDSQSAQEQQKHQHSQELKKSSSVAALWRIVALCLIYKTCSSSTKSSMPENSRNLLRVCSLISPQTWKQTIESAMKLLPKFQAEQSDCLDQWWGPQQSAWNPANIAAQHLNAPHEVPA